jgi:hypothetical protein
MREDLRKRGESKGRLRRSNAQRKESKAHKRLALKQSGKKRK